MCSKPPFLPSDSAYGMSPHTPKNDRRAREDVPCRALRCATSAHMAGESYVSRISFLLLTSLFSCHRVFPKTHRGRAGEDVPCRTLRCGQRATGVPGFNSGAGESGRGGDPGYGYVGPDTQRCARVYVHVGWPDCEVGEMLLSAIACAYGGEQLLLYLRSKFLSRTVCMRK